MSLTRKDIQTEFDAFAVGLLRKEFELHRREMLERIEQLLSVSGTGHDESAKLSTREDDVRTLVFYDHTTPLQIIEDHDGPSPIREETIKATHVCDLLLLPGESAVERSMSERSMSESLLGKVKDDGLPEDDRGENGSHNLATPPAAFKRRNSIKSSMNETISYELLTQSVLNFKLKHIVESAQFDYWAGFLVFFNAILLGVEADLEIQEALSKSDTGPTWHTERLYQIISFASCHATLRVFDRILCLCFSLELLARLFAYGCDFFRIDDWKWNVFDLIVVAVQIFETMAHMVSGLGTNTRVASVLRIARLLRITRLVRVLRLFLELRQLVNSIVGSMKQLFWTLILLATVIYAFSVFFTQLVAEKIVESGRGADMIHWYGCLGRTALTLVESILGGVSWDEPVDLLIREVSPRCGVLFCVYVAFCVFALANVVTAIFIQKSMQLAQAEKEDSLTEHITNHFMALDTSGEGVTVEVFTEGLLEETMSEAFEEIGVNPCEAAGIFELLDADGGGTLDADEIVSGLLRLKGPATALELALMGRQIDKEFVKLWRSRTRKKSKGTQELLRMFTSEDSEI